MIYNNMGSKVDGLAVREHFLSKSAWKSPILAARFSDHLTLEGASTHNFKDWDLFRMCFGKFGTWAFRWAMGRPSRIKIVRLAAIWNFFGAAMENCKKRRFLLKTLLLDIFWWENFSRIGPCQSSLPEVSENVVLLGRTIFLTGVIAAQSQHRAAKVCLSRKISDVTKKDTATILSFRVWNE